MSSRTPKPPADPLRDLIRERAESLGMLNYEELSRRCGGKPDPESISRYLRGRIALNSRYASALLQALGWDGVVGWEEVEAAGE